MDENSLKNLIRCSDFCLETTSIQQIACSSRDLEGLNLFMKDSQI